MSTVKVLKRQESSHDCFVCGMDNPLGFRAQFYELENGELLALAESKFDYQSYPNRLHGGISSTLADETMGRAIMIQDPDVWGVTIDMATQYLKPVPLDKMLRIIARITQDRRIYKAECEIILPDGTVAVKSSGRYLKMAVNKIAPGIQKSSDILFMEPVDKELAAVSVTGPLALEYR